ncbi:acetaldehyde dehydrogenase [Embleya scabrispora]|uniref:Acetaldehyde dehydrogenase n=1 Tax=Embleya scabrispora TaxID=159449 RepID=A0A1T3NVE0_9ACTN|nr:acetaldehyde dehydrogenase [Embleya scabrispora]
MVSDVEGGAVERVAITGAAAELVAELAVEHGPLLFHQSGGCCDGSSPMCYPRGEFLVGDADVLLGWVAGQPFYMSAAQFEYWRHTHLTVDVVPGRGGGFSVEAPTGRRFLIRSRVFTDDEVRVMEGEVVRSGLRH